MFYVILCFAGTNENHIFRASVQVLFTAVEEILNPDFFFKSLFNPVHYDAFLILPEKVPSQSFLFLPSYVTCCIYIFINT